jgi:hypothetical protein
LIGGFLISSSGSVPPGAACQVFQSVAEEPVGGTSGQKAHQTGRSESELSKSVWYTRLCGTESDQTKKFLDERTTMTPRFRADRPGLLQWGILTEGSSHQTVFSQSTLPRRVSGSCTASYCADSTDQCWTTARNHGDRPALALSLSCVLFSVVWLLQHCRHKTSTSRLHPHPRFYVHSFSQGCLHLGGFKPRKARPQQRRGRGLPWVTVPSPIQISLECG